jgi:hypothetical protein
MNVCQTKLSKLYTANICLISDCSDVYYPHLNTLQQEVQRNQVVRPTSTNRDVDFERRFLSEVRTSHRS